MKKKKTEYRHVMDVNTRRRKEHCEKFLGWVRAHPEFEQRKPTVVEVLKEMRHGCLKDLVEQDQEKAADAYYRSEAQYWIRHLRTQEFEIIVNKPTGTPVKAHIPLKVGLAGRIREEDYIPIREVKKKPLVAGQIVHKARADLIAWMQRYKNICEHLGIYESVQVAVLQLESQLSKALKNAPKNKKTTKKRSHHLSTVRSAGQR